MNTTHIKRGLLWSSEVSKTLFAFWVKHPEETPAVARFFFKKIAYAPKFIKRNVQTEEEQGSYEEKLKKTQKLYTKYEKLFKPADAKSYKLLEKHLEHKEQILYFLVRSMTPNTVIETGVAAGNSTGFILQALADNKKGELYSVDLPFQWYVYGNNHELHLDSLPPGRMPGYLVPEELKNRWHLSLGNTYKLLPKLVKKVKKIDMFLHDSEHTYKTMMFEYNEVWPHLTKKACLTSDDIGFTKAFFNFAKEKKVPPLTFKDIGITFRK